MRKQDIKIALAGGGRKEEGGGWTWLFGQQYTVSNTCPDGWPKKPYYHCVSFNQYPSQQRDSAVPQ